MSAQPTWIRNPQNPEDEHEWRPIPNYPGYEASSWGYIRSVDRFVPTSRGSGSKFVRGVVLRANIGPRGYRTVAPYRSGQPQRPRPVHVLVAEAFHGVRPDGLVIRHLDGDELNNCADNLAYGTQAENVQDTFRHGRRNPAQPRPSRSAYMKAYRQNRKAQ